MQCFCASVPKISWSKWGLHQVVGYGHEVKVVHSLEHSLSQAVCSEREGKVLRRTDKFSVTWPDESLRAYASSCATDGTS